MLIYKLGRTVMMHYWKGTSYNQQELISYNNIWMILQSQFILLLNLHYHSLVFPCCYSCRSTSHFCRISFVWDRANTNGNPCLFISMWELCWCIIEKAPLTTDESWSHLIIFTNPSIQLSLEIKTCFLK